MSQDVSDLEGTARTVGKLSNSAGGGGTLDLNGSIDNIANLEGAEAATGVFKLSILS